MTDLRSMLVKRPNKLFYPYKIKNYGEKLLQMKKKLTELWKKDCSIEIEFSKPKNYKMKLLLKRINREILRKIYNQS